MTRSYRYKAARADGSLAAGLVDAPTAGMAGSALLAMGLHPLRVEAAEDPRHPPAATRDLAIVLRSMASLVSAGVPVIRALASSESLASGRLRATLAAAQVRLREGEGLARALAATPGVVPPAVLGMLQAGERGGGIDGALDQAAQHLEREADLRARVLQALAYPVLLAVAGTISALVIGTVVVPKFATLLEDMGQSPPASTRLLLVVSSLLVNHGVALTAITACAVVAFAAWARRPAGTLICHRALLALPVIGDVRHGLATARFCQALGSMLQAGMPLLPALDAAAVALSDRAVEARARHARERVARGEPLTRACAVEKAVTPSALQILEVGESTGALGVMAERAGKLAAAHSERALQISVALLEPALVVVFGGFVAFVAAALLQAVYSIRPGAM